MAVSKQDFAALWSQALQAGQAAMEKVQPMPMIVTEADVITGKALDGGKSYFVAEGACGFAWVKFPKAVGPLYQWAKKAGVGKKAYGGGWQYWVTAGGQSVEWKEAFAKAFAQVFKDAGHDCYWDSKLD